MDTLPTCEYFLQSTPPRGHKRQRPTLCILNSSIWAVWRTLRTCWDRRGKPSWSIPSATWKIYLEAAQKQGLAIRHIFETHLHADFVSGHQELAARTGASIYLSRAGGATFPHVDVDDGFTLRVGKLNLEVLATPGHTLGTTMW